MNKGSRFKTRYASIMRKGSVGICIDDKGHELKIRFGHSEEHYFYKRDLEKVEEQTT